MTTSKTVALYARVSTKTKGQDADLQLTPMRAYAELNGWTIAAEYVDEGISGAKSSRPQLNQLMVDAKSRNFDIVMVWKFDRFARSTSHLLAALETFKGLGIDFASMSEKMDTSTPAGKMVFTVLGAVAELERSLIAERVKAGMCNAKAKGAKFGPKCAQVDSSELIALAGEGKSSYEISELIGLSPSTVQRRLQAA